MNACPKTRLHKHILRHIGTLFLLFLLCSNVYASDGGRRVYFKQKKSEYVLVCSVTTHACSAM